MVKVSNVQPRVAMDKTKPRKNPTNTPKGISSQSSKVATPAGVGLPTCSGCGQTVGDDIRALQCDCCQSNNAWKCTDCLDLTTELYEMLGTKGGSALKWLCDQCNLSMSVFAKLRDHHQQMEDKLNEMTSKLDKKIEEMTTTVDSRVNNNESQRLEQKLNELTTKVNKKNGRIDSGVI